MAEKQIIFGERARRREAGGWGGRNEKEKVGGGVCVYGGTEGCRMQAEWVPACQAEAGRKG